MASAINPASFDKTPPERVDILDQIAFATAARDEINALQAGKEDTGVAAGLVSAHTGETTAAHAGTAISIDPTGLVNLAPTDTNSQLAVAALNNAIGDIDTALDLINGEVI